MNGSDVAVVIPTANRWDMLERTIAGLRAQSVTGFDIVVVVDDGAEPPPFLSDVQVVHRNRRGVGAARNDGVRATQRPIVMFLGDDTIPEPDLMARHLAVHREHPEMEVGVLGDVPWAPEVANGRLQRWLDWSGTQFEYHTISGDEAGWGRLYSSNVSLKRELFIKVDGFDERFVFGYEDIELGLRLHNAGLRLLYEPEARVSHVHRYDWPAIQRRFRLVGGGEYLMVRKHPDFPPFFLRKLQMHRPVAPFSPWPWLVDYVPADLTGIRRGAEKRADAWYSKQLVAPFVAGWLAAEELEEEQMELDQYDQVASERLAEQRWLGEILPLVARSASVLVVGCSSTIGRELVTAGYRVTFVVADDEAAVRVQRRLDKHGLSAQITLVGGLSDSSAFDVALAFRVDRVVNGRELLDAAERHSALVAASLGNDTAGVIGLELLRRAERRKVALQLQDEDGTALVIYTGDQPRSGVGRPAHRELRERIARLAAQRFGRRRPWVPRLRLRVDP
jgi:glycosyltransferase involved in cell wall biosynthesis